MTAVSATFGGFPWPRSWRYFARRSGLQLYRTRFLGHKFGLRGLA